MYKHSNPTADENAKHEREKPLLDLTFLLYVTPIGWWQVVQNADWLSPNNQQDLTNGVDRTIS
jgi:hypothetical protein